MSTESKQVNDPAIAEAVRVVEKMLAALNTCTITLEGTRFQERFYSSTAVSAAQKVGNAFLKANKPNQTGVKK